MIKLTDSDPTHFNGTTTPAGAAIEFGRARQTWLHLARNGKVSAARVRGIWMIAMESAQEYHERTKDHPNNARK